MFDYQNMAEFLVPAKIYPLMVKIDGYRLKMEQNKDRLQTVYGDCQRLSLLTLGRLNPMSYTCGDKESMTSKGFPGFAMAMRKMWDELDESSLSVEYICRIHKQLMGMKNQGGILREESADDLKRLCISYEQARYNTEVPPLLLISAVSYDFLRIRPFEKGTPQIMEILLYMLLAKKGYSVGRYVVFGSETPEKVFEHETVNAGSILLDEQSTFFDFTFRLLDWIRNCYETLERRTGSAMDGGTGKMDRIVYVFEGAPVELSKRELQTILPDVSVTTLELYLAELCKRGTIKREGAGRLTAYRKNEQQEDW